MPAVPPGGSPPQAQDIAPAQLPSHAESKPPQSRREPAGTRNDAVLKSVIQAGMQARSMRDLARARLERVQAEQTEAEEQLRRADMELRQKRMRLISLNLESDGPQPGGTAMPASSKAVDARLHEEASVAALKAELDTMRVASANLQSKLSEAEIVDRSLRNALGSMLERADATRDELERARNTDRSLRQELDSSRARAADLQRELADLLGQTASIDAEMKREVTYLAALESDRDEALKRRTAAEAARSSALADAAKAVRDAAAARQQLAEQAARLAEARSRLADLDSSLRNAIAQGDERGQRLAALEAVDVARERQEETLARAVAETAPRIASLREEHAALADLGRSERLAEVRLVAALAAARSARRATESDTRAARLACARAQAVALDAQAASMEAGKRATDRLAERDRAMAQFADASARLAEAMLCNQREHDARAHLTTLAMLSRNERLAAEAEAAQARLEHARLMARLATDVAAVESARREPDRVAKASMLREEQLACEALEGDLGAIRAKAADIARTMNREIAARAQAAEDLVRLREEGARQEAAIGDLAGRLEAAHRNTRTVVEHIHALGTRSRDLRLALARNHARVAGLGAELAPLEHEATALAQNRGSVGHLARQASVAAHGVSPRPARRFFVAAAFAIAAATIYFVPRLLPNAAPDKAPPAAARATPAANPPALYAPDPLAQRDLNLATELRTAPPAR